MNMSEAMEWAADFAERAKIFEPPLKQNGYAVDKWQPPTPSQKADIIIHLAREAMKGSSDEEPVRRVPTLGSAKPPWEDDDDTPF